MSLSNQQHCFSNWQNPAEPLFLDCCLYGFSHLGLWVNEKILTFGLFAPLRAREAVLLFVCVHESTTLHLSVLLTCLNSCSSSCQDVAIMKHSNSKQKPCLGPWGPFLSVCVVFIHSTVYTEPSTGPIVVNIQYLLLPLRWLCVDGCCAKPFSTASLVYRLCQCLSCINV